LFRPRAASGPWGITLLALAVAFGLIQAAGWGEITPGVIALLVGVTGLATWPTTRGIAQAQLSDLNWATGVAPSGR